MTLLKQIMLCILQNFVNPMFEPIIIDRKITDIFALDTKLPIVQQLKKIKRLLKKIPDDDFSTNILKSNIMGFLDAIIQTNDKQIKRLEKKLAYKDSMMSELKSTPQSFVVLDTSLSENLRNATTFEFTVS